MKPDLIRTDAFFVKKHNLKIFRVAEQGTAVVLLTTEQQAVQYVQKLHVRRLIIEKEY